MSAEFHDNKKPLSTGATTMMPGRSSNSSLATRHLPLVRPAVADDVPVLAGIYVRAYAEPPWNEHIWPAWAVHYLLTVLAEPGAVCFVASPPAPLPTPIVGFALGAPRPYEAFVADWQAQVTPLPGGSWPALLGRLGYVYELAVDPRCQGRGWGGRLLDALLRALRDAGCGTIVLRSSDRATPAVRLYQRYSFRRLPLRERRDPAAGYWVLER